jgi:hypothetical protein
MRPKERRVAGDRRGPASKLSRFLLENGPALYRTCAALPSSHAGGQAMVCKPLRAKPKGFVFSPLQDHKPRAQAPESFSLLGCVGSSDYCSYCFAAWRSGYSCDCLFRSLACPCELPNRGRSRLVPFRCRRRRRHPQPRRLRQRHLPHPLLQRRLGPRILRTLLASNLERGRLFRFVFSFFDSLMWRKVNGR